MCGEFVVGVKAVLGRVLSKCCSSVVEVLSKRRRSVVRVLDKYGNCGVTMMRLYVKPTSLVALEELFVCVYRRVAPHRIFEYFLFAC